MGRASIALGAPDSSSGIMDGFTSDIYLCVKEPNGDSTFGPSRVGSALPTSARSNQTDTQESQPTQEQVTNQQLWCQLPREQQLRFACCFSQMLLKCFNVTRIEKGRNRSSSMLKSPTHSGSIHVDGDTSVEFHF